MDNALFFRLFSEIVLILGFHHLVHLVEKNTCHTKIVISEVAWGHREISSKAIKTTQAE